jgi:hypothetical protein
MWPSGARPDAYRIPSTPQAATTALNAPTTIPLPASVRTTVSGVEPAQFLLWVVMVWLTGAVVFWVRLVGGWAVAARMQSTRVRPAPSEWQEILGKLGARIGLSRPVRLRVDQLSAVKPKE